MEGAGEHVFRAKVLPPSHPTSILVRRRLWDLLDEVSGAETTPRLALVVAPAGFGKTTLLTSWQPSVRDRGRPVAWCSLDDTDSDSAHFWSSALSALSLSGDRVATQLKGLAAPHRPGNRNFIADLIGAVSDQHIVLVLENLHEITDPGVLSDLNRFITHLPADLTLIMSSRSDPPLRALQSAKLSGDLTQIRANELAFRSDEVAQWCQELSPDQSRSIWEWTEGWPAMVRLMDLQVKAGIDVESQLADTDFGLADHLFYEAFRRHPGHVQHTLMLSAIPDAVTIELAVKLSGQQNAGQILESIAQESGLVTRTAQPALGETGYGETVYRLHPMLRAYLQGALLRQDRQAANTAHRATATWCISAGLSAWAVKHAAASGDPTFVEDVIKTVGAGLINAGQAGLLLRAMEHSERPDSHAWTAVIRATALLDVGQLNAAEIQVHQVRQLIGTSPTHSRWGDDVDFAIAFRAAEAHLQRRQGSHEPLPDVGASTAGSDLDLRLLMAAQLGSLRVWAGDLAAAEEDLRLGVATARGLDRTAALIDCLAYLGGVHACRSEIEDLVEVVDEALELGRTHGWAETPRMAYPHALRAWASWQLMDPHLALEHIERAHELLEPGADPIIGLSVIGLAAALRSVTGESPAQDTNRVHEAFHRLAKLKAPPAILGQLGLIDAAMSVAIRRLRNVAEIRDVLATHFGPCAELTLIDAMAKCAQGHQAEARKSLTTLLATNCPPSLSPSTTIEAAALASGLAYVHGDFFAATALARRALSEATQSHCLASLLSGGQDFGALLRANIGRWGTHEAVVERVLDQLAGPHVSAQTSLTVRELDILQELPNLNTVDEIAEALCVSPNTVKTHLRSVYRKLNVSSRRAAVTEARRLQLL